MKRKEFFKDGIKGLARDVWKSPVGQIFDRRVQGLANILDPRGLDYMLSNLPENAAEQVYDSRHYARPPGARPDPQEFSAACTKCSECIVACPYGVIFSLGGDSGPLLDPNSVACQLCPDMPCISACPTDALQDLPPNSIPKFGQAELVPGACRNTGASSQRTQKKSGGRNKYCQECKKACPVPGVIKYGKDKLPVFADHCAGCGICIPACPAEPVAIRVNMDYGEP